MLRRVFSTLPRLALTVAARFYTPSPELQELYSSNFDMQEFPTNIVPSDSVLFAKFLFKAADKDKSYDAVLQDFSTIAEVVPNLPVFWERTCKIDDIDEFSSLSEPTIFTLHWMESNGMLDLLPDVAQVYEAYVNAQLKRAMAKIYVAPDAVDDDETINAALEEANQMLENNSALKGYTLSHKVIVDRTIVSGFAIDLNGVYVNKAVGHQVAAHEADESDFIAVPQAHVTRTSWDDNTATEYLRKYLDSLADYDAEEMRYGVEKL